MEEQEKGKGGKFVQKFLQTQDNNKLKNKFICNFLSAASQMNILKQKLPEDR